MNLIDHNIYFHYQLSEFQSIISDYEFSKIMILVDRNTLNYCLSAFLDLMKFPEPPKIIMVEPGEENKNLSGLTKIWTEMETADRDSLLINLGGGVITDMGGLAASVFKRGIKFINIPTTVLAMADASVGGKTGVNLNNIKNHIGLFSNPLATFIYPDYLNTISERQILSGMAEIIKIGFISDSLLFEETLKWNTKEKISIAIIEKAIQAKIAIVESDPIEKSNRKLLNFGHTIGHAIETYSLENHKEPLLHGEAIALGMIAESFISSELNMLNNNDFTILTKLILNLYNSKLNLYLPNFEVLKIMKNDKKNNREKINFTLPVEIGKGKINCYIDAELISKSIDYLNSL